MECECLDVSILGRGGAEFGTYEGMFEALIVSAKVSLNGARCSLRRMTGLDRLMWRGNWAPRSVCKRLCMEAGSFALALVLALVLAILF